MTWTTAWSRTSLAQWDDSLFEDDRAVQPGRDWATSDLKGNNPVADGSIGGRRHRRLRR